MRRLAIFLNGAGFAAHAVILTWALATFPFWSGDSSAVGIIGGDGEAGPTAIYVATSITPAGQFFLMGIIAFFAINLCALIKKT